MCDYLNQTKNYLHKEQPVKKHLQQLVSYLTIEVPLKVCLTILPR